MGWQEPGKNQYWDCISMTVYHWSLLLDSYFALHMIAFSDSYNWFGCWWEPIWCCSWWNCVSYSVISMYLLKSCFFLVVCLALHVYYCHWLCFLFNRGQALCTTAAVIGGKSLASQISEKIVIMEFILLSWQISNVVYVSFFQAVCDISLTFCDIGCTLGRSSFHWFWDPVFPCNSWIVRSMILVL